MFRRKRGGILGRLFDHNGCGPKSVDGSLPDEFGNRTVARAVGAIHKKTQFFLGNTEVDQSFAVRRVDQRFFDADGAGFVYPFNHCTLLKCLRKSLSAETHVHWNQHSWIWVSCQRERIDPQPDWLDTLSYICRQSVGIGISFNAVVYVP